MEPYKDATERATAQNLWKAFMQFNKSEWHQKTVAGCKPSELRALFCIKKGMLPDIRQMKVSEISKSLHVTSPTITQLIKSLQAQGLVERSIDPADRRVVYIKLTEKGNNITREAADAFLSSLNGLIAYLGEEQSNQLAELLTKVFTYFSEKEENFSQSQRSGDEKA